jgi:predicted ATPase/Tfp pilus assembly protein PilF
MGTFIARENELAELRTALAYASDGKGCARVITGEAGIGKSRLTAETIKHATAMGFSVAIGSASKESMQPFLVFSGAMASLTTLPLFERKETANFSTVMAINNVNGEVMGKATRTGSDTLDADTFAGMLSAVQDFIRDSFVTEGALRRLEHGNWKILAERCGGLSIIAVMEGAESPEMRAAVKNAADKISSEPGQTDDCLEMLAAQNFVVKNELEGLKLENERLRIANGVLETLRESCKTGPLLLILEDVHWADESSLFVLRYVARNLDGFRVMLLATARPSEGIEAQKAIALMRKEGTLSEISLAGFGLADVANLVHSTLHPNDFPQTFNEHLHRDCAGNPFFISELLRQMLVDSAITSLDGKYTLANTDYTMPSSIGEIVERRLESLDPDVMAMAEYASCIGHEFETAVALAAPLLENSRELLEKLRTAGIVKFTGATWEFSHALFQSAIHDSLTLRWKSAHHRSIGEYFENAFAGRLNDAAYELARHFSSTADHAKSFIYNDMAGEKAEKSLAAETALGFCSQALDALAHWDLAPDRVGTERRLRFKMGELHTLLGAYGNAEASFEHAIRLSGGDLALEARARRKLADVMERQAKYTEALEQVSIVERTLDAAHPLELSGALVSKGFIQIRKSDFSGSIATTKSALAMLVNLEGHQAKREYVNALTNIATAHMFMGNFTESKRRNLEILALREEMGNEMEVGSTLNNLSNGCASMGDREEALGYLERALRIAEKYGDARGIGVVNINIGNLYAERGDFPTAMQYYERAIEFKRRTGDVRGLAVALNNIGVIQMERGDYPAALTTYQNSLETRIRMGDKAGAALTLRNIGSVRLEMGDAAEARDLLERAVAESEAVGDRKHAAFSLCWLAEAQLALGELEAAMKSYSRATAICEGTDVRDTMETARMVHGRILVATGDFLNAIINFRTAIAAFEVLEMPVEVSKTRYHLANALSSNGEISEACDELCKATAAFKILGNVCWLARCEEKQTELGCKVP